MQDGDKNVVSEGGATMPPLRRRWMHRRPRLALLMVNLGGLLLLSSIVEVCLRASGMHAGALDMGWSNFQPLPADASLRVSHEFYTDSLGIFKAAAQHEPGYVVNADGFRGPDFAPADSSRKKIMLIGDSFTWGAHATPLDSSFADRLRRPDWQVMNFGIPGADPDQYASIAEHYIPRMQPDLVCLFFYMANDVMEIPQHVGPYQSRYHLTNVGWLDPFVDGAYIGDAQATYEYCCTRFKLPETNLFNRLCAQTVIGTLFWRALLRLEMIDAGYPPAMQARYDATQATRKKGPYSSQYLQQVQATCAANKIPLLLFIIPLHTAIQAPSAEERNSLFPEMNILYPPTLTGADYYPRPDAHFNNAGHRKMADFVAAEIEKTIAN
jgi:lysophospholipase L1-like esterase